MPQLDALSRILREL